MAINLQKHCDKRAISGYGSALLYRDPSKNESKYHLLIPLETVPSVNGSVDSFEFDLLTCPSKGSVEGKESLDQKDVEFLWHRDNVKRLESLQGRVIDFLAVYGDFTGRKFSGTIKVRPNDVSNDVARGTFTITPISASTTTCDDVREIIMDTVAFADTIDDYVEIDTTGKTAVVATRIIKVRTNPTDATIVATPDTAGYATVTVKQYNKSDEDVSLSGTTDKVVAYNGISVVPVKAGGTIVNVKASKTGMADWETSFYVEVIGTPTTA